MNARPELKRGNYTFPEALDANVSAALAYFPLVSFLAFLFGSRATFSVRGPRESRLHSTVFSALVNPNAAAAQLIARSEGEREITMSCDACTNSREEISFDVCSDSATPGCAMWCENVE